MKLYVIVILFCVSLMTEHFSHIYLSFKNKIQEEFSLRKSLRRVVAVL